MKNETIWAYEEVEFIPDSLRNPIAMHLVRKYFQLGAMRRVGYVAPTMDAFDAECFAIIEGELARLRAKGNKDGGKNTG